MTRGKLIPLLLLALIAALLILRFSRSSPEGEPSPSSRETPAPANVTPISKKWTGADLEELQEWSEADEESRSSGTTLKFDSIVNEGEMLVTDIIETAPGVFRFTQLTPQPGTEKDTILLKAQRLSVDLDGNTGILSAPSILLKSGSSGTVSISSEDSLYEIQFRAEITGDGTRLTGHVLEDGNDIQ